MLPCIEKEKAGAESAKTNANMSCCDMFVRIVFIKRNERLHYYSVAWYNVTKDYQARKRLTNLFSEIILIFHLDEVDEFFTWLDLHLIYSISVNNGSR